MITAALLVAALVANATETPDQRCLRLRADEMSGSVSAAGFGGGLTAVGLLGVLGSVVGYAYAASVDLDGQKKASVFAGLGSAIIGLVGGIVMGSSNRGFEEHLTLPCAMLIADDDARIELMKKRYPQTAAKQADETAAAATTPTEQSITP